MTNLKNQIREEIKERLDELEGIYTCDAMNELYNRDYYIIGTYQAKEFLKENFDELFEALEDYQENIGQQYPDITNPEKMASLTVLYIADQVWNELETVKELWNDELTEEDLQQIKDELE